MEYHSSVSPYRKENRAQKKHAKAGKCQRGRGSGALWVATLGGEEADFTAIGNDFWGEKYALLFAQLFSPARGVKHSKEQ